MIKQLVSKKFKLKVFIWNLRKKDDFVLSCTMHVLDVYTLGYTVKFSFI